MNTRVRVGFTMDFAGASLREGTTQEMLSDEESRLNMQDDLRHLFAHYGIKISDVTLEPATDE